MWYEVIYETGSYSIMQCESDDDADAAAFTQHQRAIAGQAGGTTGTNHTAERVVRVLVYPTHPQDYTESGLVSTAVAIDAVGTADLGGQVSVAEAAARLRDLTSPLCAGDAHESNYKMPEERELELTWL